jgi:glycerol kinase
MQLQSDVAQVSVERPKELESTARGAAMLAGVGAGLFSDGADAAKMLKIERTFEVRMDEADRCRRLAAWQDAVRRARSTP